MSDLLLDDVEHLLARCRHASRETRAVVLTECRIRIAAAVRRGTVDPTTARALLAGLLTAEREAA